MTWEETIEKIRNNPEYKALVRDAYFDSDLVANVERFKAGPEFNETLSILKENSPQATTIADIGSGNGISALAFALEGYEVWAVEPDPSNTIGAGAIRTLADYYKLADHIAVVERFGEETGLPEESVDIVYIRQAMHHAHNLNAMMKECYRILRPGGMLLTVRDHVIFDHADKEWFLKAHPLHKFYGGENAYTEQAYKKAMEAAGFKILKVLKYYDSVINYFPLTEADVDTLAMRKEEKLMGVLRKRIGPLAHIKLIQDCYKKYHKFDPATVYDERLIAGRMYTFLALKP